MTTLSGVIENPAQVDANDLGTIRNDGDYIDVDVVFYEVAAKVGLRAPGLCRSITS